MDEELNLKIGKPGNKKRVISLQKVRVHRGQEGLLVVHNFIKILEEIGIQ